MVDFRRNGEFFLSSRFEVGVYGFLWVVGLGGFILRGRGRIVCVWGGVVFRRGD